MRSMNASVVLAHLRTTTGSWSLESEIRNPKPETSSNSQWFNVLNCFGSLDLFRASCFGFRIYARLVMVAALLLGFVFSGASASAPLQQTDVFVSGQGGYHTYRIPALIVTSNQTLLAFCEGRKHSRSDTGDIDLLLKRSTDSGKT